MTYRITAQPAQRQFEASDDETILEAALRQGLTMPYGCRDGACGACKGRILAGEVRYRHTPQALTADEQAAGMALFCCAQAAGDLVIESRVAAADDIPVKTMPTRVERMERLAPDVMGLWLRLPASERLQFRAGQYIDILLKDGQRRSFSLANAPREGEPLELHIRHVPDGLFTEQVFSTLKVRDILRINGPHGSFWLREESTKPVILVAGGTGFAPIKGLVEAALDKGCKRPMHLYWGARSQIDLYLPELPLQWSARQEQFTYVPVLSAPLAGDAWEGRQGLVHAAVLADFPDLAGFQVYACGAPVMIDAARRDFLAAGLPDSEFFADSFAFAARS